MVAPTHVVLRRTDVIDDTVKLPRPKQTQEVILIGSKEDCMAKLEELSKLKQNQSSEIIQVDLLCLRWAGQKTYNSKEIRKDNGKTRSN